MANRIYTNGEEGKILTSVGNRIIKQPYEFGNAFQNRMGLNNYFEATSLNIQKGWSILAIANIKTNDDQGWVQLVSTSLGLADNPVVRQSTFVTNLIDNISGYILMAFSTSSPLYISLTDNSAWFKGSTIDRSTNIVTEGTRDILRIAAVGNYSNNTIPISRYCSSTSLLNRIYIFNRELSLGEITYFKNNLLYNELQSREGLIYEFDLSKAEIINIDGVDNVCARELVNSRHAIMYNLPAGTLQQKCDYANANLFVPFI